MGDGEKGGYSTNDPIFSEPNRRLKEIWSQVEDAVRANRVKLEEDISEETKITNNRFIALIIAGAVSIVAVFVVLNPNILQISAIYTGYATEILSVIIFAVIALEIIGARSKHIVNVRALRGKFDKEAKAEISEYEKEATRQTQVMFDLAIKGGELELKNKEVDGKIAIGMEKIQALKMQTQQNMALLTHYLEDDKRDFLRNIARKSAEKALGPE